tara:strand:+ start:500 stop:652 length:153 start_codon:yes stop_codon:yes gene_type:complete
MSNHQNEELLENLYDEEYANVCKRWPTLPEDLKGKFAAHFAQERFEEQSE